MHVGARTTLGWTDGMSRSTSVVCWALDADTGLATDTGHGVVIASRTSSAHCLRAIFSTIFTDRPPPWLYSAAHSHHYNDDNDRRKYLTIASAVEIIF